MARVPLIGKHVSLKELGDVVYEKEFTSNLNPSTRNAKFKWEKKNLCCFGRIIGLVLIFLPSPFQVCMISRRRGDGRLI